MTVAMLYRPKTAHRRDFVVPNGALWQEAWRSATNLRPAQPRQRGFNGQAKNQRRASPETGKDVQRETRSVSLIWQRLRSRMRSTEMEFVFRHYMDGRKP